MNPTTLQTLSKYRDRHVVYPGPGADVQWARKAVAASYNGGEDNASRWLNRTKPKDPGIFTAEIGFAETKNYVFKVMTNYRMYKALYDENLNAK